MENKHLRKMLIFVYLFSVYIFSISLNGCASYAKRVGELGDGKNYTVNYLDHNGKPFLEVTSKFIKQDVKGKYQKYNVDVYDLIFRNLTDFPIELLSSFTYTNSGQLETKSYRNKEDIEKFFGTSLINPQGIIIRKESWFGNRPDRKPIIFTGCYKIRFRDEIINIKVLYHYQ